MKRCLICLICDIMWELHHEWPTLYKQKGKLGKWYQWRIVVYKNAKGHGRYVSTYGYVDGVMQDGGKTFEEGNTRKSALELAYTRAEKLHNDKIKKDQFGFALSSHVEDADVVTNDVEMRPMLAHNIWEHYEKMKWPNVDAQWKLDGVRAIYDGTHLISRKGTEFHNMTHISDDLHDMPSDVVYDGELFNRDMSFDDMSGIIRAKTSRADEKLKIQYWIFDVYMPKHPDMSWAQRRDWMLKNIKETDNIVLLSTDIGVSSWDEAQDITKRYVEMGFEGAIFRNTDAPYRVGKRSHDLLKMKFFQDDEFEYVGWKEGTGRFKGTPIIICATSDGVEFSITPKLEMQQRQDLLLRLRDDPPPKGCQYTVRYQELTKNGNGVPRFPVGVGFRDYE